MVRAATLIVPVHPMPHLVAMRWFNEAANGGATYQRLLEAGANRVDLNPTIVSLTDPAALAKYDVLIARIRALGLQIVVNLERLLPLLKVSHDLRHESSRPVPCVCGSVNGY
ncbi:hypothetical protein ACFL5Q_00305 [Planctomycetota bacterium]